MHTGLHRKESRASLSLSGPLYVGWLRAQSFPRQEESAAAGSHGRGLRQARLLLREESYVQRERYVAVRWAVAPTS